MIEGKTLESINYFDENVFLYYEEDILAKKLKEKNLLSKCNCNIQVKHMHNATIGNNVSNLNKYKIHANSKFYYEKTYNKARLSMLLFKLFYLINLIPYKIKAKKK
jgi:GT2 family glycosyltransferase